jgi:ferredoxin
VRAEIDRSACVGHGLCYSTAPHVFDDDEDGYGQVRHDGEVAVADEPAARHGAAACPERAVSLT